MLHALQGTTHHECELCPPKKCPECKGRPKILTVCKRCSSTGVVPVMARWSIKMGPITSFLCQKHAKGAGVAWECPKCAQTNWNSGKCHKCQWAKPGDCAKCGRHVGEGSFGIKGHGGVSLVKLMADTCPDCHGTGHPPCHKCLGTGNCDLCIGQGTMEGSDCTECGGDGKCDRCDADVLAPNYWTTADPPERDLTRDPESHCITCHGQGRLRHMNIDSCGVTSTKRGTSLPASQRSAVTRGDERRMFINDIPTIYHAELSEFVGAMICWVCALPDMVISPYFGEGRKCLECEQDLSGYNGSPYCWAHQDLRNCRECGKRLQLDEHGVYCREHHKCAKCGGDPEPWSMFCRVHRDIKGFGLQTEPGVTITGKPGEPSKFLSRIESLARLKTIYEKRLAIAQERHQRIKARQDKILHECEDIEARLGKLTEDIRTEAAAIAETESRYREAQANPNQATFLSTLYHDLELGRRKLAMDREQELALRTQLTILTKVQDKMDGDVEATADVFMRTADVLHMLPYSMEHLQDAYTGWKYDPWARVDRPRPEPVDRALITRISCEDCREVFSDPTEVIMVNTATAAMVPQERARNMRYLCSKCRGSKVTGDVHRPSREAWKRFIANDKLERASRTRALRRELFEND